MLALYFICMMMNLALPTLNILSLIVLLLYMYISVYMRWASRCVCWDGNSGSSRAWGKTGRRRRFGYLGGGELETTNLGSGWGCTPQCIPACTVFGAQVLGFYWRLEDMSSPRSESEWTDLFTGPFCTHHITESGVRAELSSASAEPYLPVG
jgi:hypothetical protein